MTCRSNFLASLPMDDLEPDFGPPPQGKPKKRKAAEGLTTKSGQVLVIFSRPEKGQEGLDEVRFEGSLCIQSSAGKSVSAEQLQLHLRALQDDWLRSFRATRAKWSVKQKKQHADDLKDLEATSFIWVLSVQRFRVQAQAEGDYVFGQASFVGRQFQPVGSFANVGLLEKIAGVAVDFADGTSHRSCTFRDFCESVQCSTATRQARCLIIPRSVADRALSSDPLDGLLLPGSFAKRLQISVSGQLELEEKTKGLPVHMVKATTLSGARDPQVRNHDIPLSVFYGALGHYCQSLADIGSIVQLVGDMLLPALSLNVLQDIRVPNQNVVSFFMTKLDLLHTLSRRLFSRAGNPEIRRARYLASDSSPQGGYDYFAITEEIISRPKDPQAWALLSENFNPFGGFEWERRTMPLTTLARGHGNSSMKFSRMLHAIIQEQGTEGIPAYRKEVLGYLSDQGTERHLFSYPFCERRTLHGLAKGLLDGNTSLADVAEVPCFYNALGCPGALHIVFNALEDALKMCEDWKPFETELRAVSKVFGHKSYVELVIQYCVGLTPADEAHLRSLQVQLLDWRWESIEFIAKFWLRAISILRDKWSDESSLGHTEVDLAKAIGSALRSEQNEVMTLWTCSLSGALGECARWLEGCFCHEKSIAFRGKRKRLSAEKMGQHCPWKGRRLCSLAWQGGGCFVSRLEGSEGELAGGSQEFQQRMLTCSPELSARMVEMNSWILVHLNTVLQSKFAWCTRLPFKIAGAFSLYVDKELLEVTSFVRSCFEEFRTAHHEMDVVSRDLFGMETSESRELWEFCMQDEHTPDLRSLECFPHAFVAVQERAFTPLAERHLESQHKGIKWALQRGFKKAMPATTCARQRRRQVVAMLKSAAQKEFVIMNWSTRSMWSDLLGHVVAPADIAKMSLAQKLARCYCYSQEDHFVETPEDDDAAAAFLRALAGTGRPAFTLTADMRQWVSFLKQQLGNGVLCTFPLDVFELLGSDPEYEEALADADSPGFELDNKTLQAGLGEQEMELPDFTSEAFVFCQVVDARPENRAKVKQGAAESSNRTTMLVQEFPRVKWLQKQAPDATVEVSKQGARTVLLDLERACSEDIFVRMMREVCVWSCETAGRQMELRGIAAEPGDVADIFEVEDARLPRLLEDEASLVALMQQANAVVPQPGPEQVVVQAAGINLSVIEQEAAAAVLNAGAVGSTAVPVASVTSARVSLATVLRLAERRVVQIFEDDFGEWLVHIAAPFLLHMSLHWKHPVPLSHAQVAAHRRSHVRGLNKIEFVRGLVRMEWTWPGRQQPKQLECDGPRIIPAKVLSRPEAHLKCLFLAPILFGKPGGLKVIFHTCTEQYYNFLLQAEDMSSISGLSLQQISGFLASLKQPRKRAGRKAIQNPNDEETEGALELPERSHRVSSFEELREYLAAQEEPPEPLLGRPDIKALPPVMSKIPGQDQIKVYFDNYTHQSGRLRAFCQCPKHGKKCRLYVFVDVAGKDRSVAKLLAWISMAAAAKHADDHLALRPTEAEIDVMVQRQAMGV